jgi:hypothetical protein
LEEKQWFTLVYLNQRVCGGSCHALGGKDALSLISPQFLTRDRTFVANLFSIYPDIRVSVGIKKW